MIKEYFRPIQVEGGLCVHCERCVMNCPNNAIQFIGNQRIINFPKCRGCLTCVNVCPRNAITVTSVETNQIVSIDVNYNKCNGCGICRETCLNNLFEQYKYKNIDEKLVYRVPSIKIKDCVDCELCVKKCPEKAIKIQKILFKE